MTLVGPNGAGKTTFLLLLNGILKPTSGQICVEDHPLDYKQASLAELRRRVGFVFQDPNDQLFAATVRQDVAFGPLNMGLSIKEVETRVSEALECVEMTEYADRPPHFLSMGQMKRVAIAGVLSMRPDIIVMDEPTSLLDNKMAEQIMSLLSKSNSEGKTIITSTHDVDAALEWADLVLVLKSGTLLAQGSPMEVFENEDIMARSDLKIPFRLELLNHLRNHSNNLTLQEMTNWLLQKNGKIDNGK